MTLKFCVAGLNHRTAPVGVRERLSFPGETLSEALCRMKGMAGISGGVILSTCNRVEIYFTTFDPEKGFESIEGFLSSFHDIAIETFAPHLYKYSGKGALSHLLRVSSGLDSMIVGEPQILGQVKGAFEVSMKLGTSDKVLNQMMKFALRTGKRVRNDTGLGQGAVSVSYAAVATIKRHLKTLKGKDILVIGTGEMGSLTAKYFEASGAGRLIFASRTRERGEEAAGRFGGESIPLEGIYDVAADVDVVVSATSSPHFVLRRGDVLKVIQKRGGRPLLIFDMAIPRDVDPALSGEEGVILYDIDHLKGVTSLSMKRRREAVPEAEEIVEEETGKAWRWIENEELVPIILSLKEELDTMRLKEIERIRKSCPSLSEEEFNLISRTGEKWMNKALHRRITDLKKGLYKGAVSPLANRLPS